MGPLPTPLSPQSTKTVLCVTNNPQFLNVFSTFSTLQSGIFCWHSNNWWQSRLLAFYRHNIVTLWLKFIDHKHNVRFYTGFINMKSWRWIFGNKNNSSSLSIICNMLHPAICRHDICRAYANKMLLLKNKDCWLDSTRVAIKSIIIMENNLQLGWGIWKLHVKLILSLNTNTRQSTHRKLLGNQQYI